MSEPMDKREEVELMMQGPTESIWDALQRHHAQLKASLAANREQKSEIELLKVADGLSCELHGCASPNCTTSQYLTDAANMIAELASLRSSVGGEKPEDAFERGQAAMRSRINNVLFESGNGLVAISTAPYIDPPLAARIPLCAIFDLDRLHVELERNLPTALRDLADAIESKQMDGNLAGFTPCGLAADRHDTRAHLIVKLHLSAEIRKQLSMDEATAVREVFQK